MICLGAFTYTWSVVGSETLATSISSIFLSPFQNISNSITLYFDGIYQKNFEYETLVSENTELKTKLSQIEDDLRIAEFYIEENEHLKSILGIKLKNTDYEFEIAEIIGRNLNTINGVLTINKGSNVGIELNDTVITNDGLVGYISRVSYNNAQITTILDPSWQIGVLTSSSREIGIAEGSLELLNDGYVKLSYLDKNTQVKIGDTIETSGIGGIYPSGVLIGLVVSVATEDHGVSKYAKVKPFVDINALSQVYIIKNFEGEGYAD